jgi:hypothetical protein
MRWTTARFVAFSSQLKVRSARTRDKASAERDRILEVIHEPKNQTEALIQELLDSVKLAGLDKRKYQTK